jgi:hypothetical protein
MRRREWRQTQEFQEARGKKEEEEEEEEEEEDGGKGDDQMRTE